MQRKKNKQYRERLVKYNEASVRICLLMHHNLCENSNCANNIPQTAKNKCLNWSDFAAFSQYSVL